MKIKQWMSFVLLLGGIGLLFGVNVPSAHALSLTPDDADSVTDDNSNCELGCDWVPPIVVESGATLLYKSDQGGSDSGSFAASYNTVYDNTPTDPMDATISYVGGPSIGCPFCYLIVKDGNAEPAQYFFDISNLWNGTDTIFLTDFWPSQGAISNVQIWGVEGGTPGGGPQGVIPEPATVLLFGSGLAGLGLWRWSQKK